jgi:hypothetical protein
MGVWMSCSVQGSPIEMRRVKSKVKSMLIIFLTSREWFTKNLYWQAKQSLLYTTVTFYGDWVKMWEDFASNFGHKWTGCCITTMQRPTLSFHQGIFLLKTKRTVTPRPRYFSVSPTEDKTERPPFWHNWGDWGRIAGGAEHPHRTQLPGCI